MARKGRTTAGRRLARASGALVLGLALVLGVPGTRAASAADDELVAFLVKEGRAALDKGKIDDAVAKLRKATVEDRDAPQAWAWLGQALEKKGDRAGAVEAYRAVPPAAARRRAAGALAADVEEAVKRAWARLVALAPGEAELRRLQEEHLADLLALARSTVERDPATARRAVDAALAIAPGDPAARDLAGRLGVEGRPPEKAGPPGPAGGDAGADPLAGLATWDDLVLRKAFESDHAAYDGATLTYEVRDEGEIAWAEPPPETGERFALDMEMRVLDRTAVTSHAGWAFYEDGSGFVAAFLERDGVVLFQAAGEERKDLDRADVPAPKDGAAWRRLTVSVERRRHVVVAVDGKAVLAHDLPETFGAEGRVGVWTQRAKVEYRRLRVGRP